MSSIRKHFSLEAANFSLFSQEGEVTSSLIPWPAWSLRLQFTKYQQRYATMIFLYFFCNSTYSLYPEHRIIQEPVFVLHLFTCHGRIMPRLAELLSKSLTPSILQQDLQHLESWEKAWDMEFNPSKCQVIHITKSCRPAQNKHYLHGVLLEAIPAAKYLGGDISENLSWNTHISRISKNLQKS